MWACHLRERPKPKNVNCTESTLSDQCSILQGSASTRSRLWRTQARADLRAGCKPLKSQSGSRCTTVRRVRRPPRWRAKLAPSPPRCLTLIWSWCCCSGGIDRNIHKMGIYCCSPRHHRTCASAVQGTNGRGGGSNTSDSHIVFLGPTTGLVENPSTSAHKPSY
jgi:hypothetical protein